MMRLSMFFIPLTIFCFSQLIHAAPLCSETYLNESVRIERDLRAKAHSISIDKITSKRYSSDDIQVLREIVFSDLLGHIKDSQLVMEAIRHLRTIDTQNGTTHLTSLLDRIVDVNLQRVLSQDPNVNKKSFDILQTVLLTALGERADVKLVNAVFGALHRNIVQNRSSVDHFLNGFWNGIIPFIREIDHVFSFDRVIGKLKSTSPQGVFSTHVMHGRHDKVFYVLISSFTVSLIKQLHKPTLSYGPADRQTREENLKQLLVDLPFFAKNELSKSELERLDNVIELVSLYFPGTRLSDWSRDLDAEKRQRIESLGGTYTGDHYTDSTFVVETFVSILRPNDKDKE